MTELQLRRKVVAQARSYLGCKESDGSHMKIIDRYNQHKPLARGYKVAYRDAWCATFVSTVGIDLGLTDIMPTECSCSRLIRLYEQLGRWQEADDYMPQIGDLVMYDWEDDGTGDNRGAPNHVGIVAVVNGTSLTVIEGNYNNEVGYRALKVNGKYIRGYCVPDYASRTKGKGVVIDYAMGKSDLFNRSYTVTANALNMRSGASTTKAILKVLKKGEKVRCYGFYTKHDATIWLLAVAGDGTTGFCSKKYLK